MFLFTRNAVYIYIYVFWTPIHFNRKITQDGVQSPAARITEQCGAPDHRNIKSYGVRATLNFLLNVRQIHCHVSTVYSAMHTDLKQQKGDQLIHRKCTEEKRNMILRGRLTQCRISSRGHEAVQWRMSADKNDTQYSTVNPVKYVHDFVGFKLSFMGPLSLT